MKIMKKYLSNAELYKQLEFVMCEEYITTKIKDGRPVRVIDDFRQINKTCSIIDAMKSFAKSLGKSWCPDFYYAKCSNCTIYIDGWYEDDDEEPVVTASLGFERSHSNESFEFIIATLGEYDDEYKPLVNMHYIEEGKILKLSNNFKIRK